MESQKVLEEKLLEVCSLGDHDHAVMLVQQNGARVNSQHAINGWSPLHWAAKRGHTSIVSFLLASGADKTIKNDKGQVPLDIATNRPIRELLGGDPNIEAPPDNLPIQPNYLQHPVFPYSSPLSEKPRKTESAPQSVPSLSLMTLNSHQRSNGVVQSSPESAHRPQPDQELVIKARVANITETDFIEVELSWDKLSFYNLMDTLTKELQVEPSLVQKIRKLPDTIVRKDKDVQRLQPFQELELVLTSRAQSQGSRNYGPQPRHENVVY